MSRFLRLFIVREGVHEIQKSRPLRKDLVTQEIIWHYYVTQQDGQVGEEVRSGDFGEPLRHIAGLVEAGWAAVSLTTSPTPYPEWYGGLFWHQN